MDRNRILSPEQIEDLIADGQVIVIYAGQVLRLDGWLSKHPGGRLVLLHMVGRDATDEISMYHNVQTQRLMGAYRVGKIQQPWTHLVPPIRGGIYHKQRKTDEEPKSALKGDEQPGPVTQYDCCRARNPLQCTKKDQDIESCQDMAKSKVEQVSALGKLNPSSSNKLSREAYIAAMEQQEIDGEIQDYPSLDCETQRAISVEYQALHERVKKEGFYVCRYSEYCKDLLRWLVLFSAFIYFLHKEWYITSAVFLGMFWQQIMFVAHDAGHRGITGSFVADTLIGAFVADFCCGLSIGWWKSSHNVHHLVTNMPEHDPDSQNVPLFATSPTFFKSVSSTFYDFSFIWDATADRLVKYQKWTYYPIMALARFNLYFLSWLHLATGARNHGNVQWTRITEILMMMCYWTWFGYGLVWRTLPDWPTRVAFVVTAHAMTMLLHVQITLSHWGMPTADLGPNEAFPQRQLRTTMDIDCPPWLDFLHGGLQFQAVHHLFPRVPRHNLRRLQTLVREFCAKTQVKYKCYNFVEGNKVVLNRLEEISRMIETLVQCQLHMSETGESGLH